MKDIKSTLKNIFLFIILIAITFLIIFKNYNFKETFDMILNANILYIVLAILCMLFYFIAEGLNNMWILAGLGKKIGILQSIKYSIIGFFFSGITPAAGGGQPMQVYFMSRDGVPSSFGTLSLLVQLITFHAITLAFGIFGVIFNYKLMSSGMIILFLIGLTLKSLVLALMYICFRNKYAAKKITDFTFKILEKFKIKDLAKKKKDANNVIEEYNNGAWYIRKHKQIFVKSICIIFMQVVLYYTLSYFIYKSFGYSSYNWIEIITIQAVLYVSVASIPLPGSVGVSEGAFLSLYEYTYGAGTLASAMIITRGINFYLFVLIGSLVTLGNGIYLSRKKDNKKADNNLKDDNK